MPETEKTEKARAAVSEFVAVHLSAPWKAPLPFPSAPPSSWATSVEWSVRGALCVFAGMVYATHPEILGDAENPPPSWVAAPLFTPVLAVALMGFCAVRCVGSVMLVSKMFCSGGLIGAVFAIISCEIARPVAKAGEPSQDRDLIMYLMSAVIFTWFCTRPNLAPPQKKLACAIYALSVGAATLKNYPESETLDWLYPMKLVLTCAIGAAVAVLAVLLPLPRPMLAVSELKTRARYHADLVRAVLLTNNYLTLTADPVAFAHLETLMAETEANAAALGPLLMLSKMEITFGLLDWTPFAWQRSLVCRLQEMVKHVHGSLVPLQESVFVINVNASAQWIGKISGEQARLSLAIMKPLHTATVDFCDAFAATVDACLDPSSYNTAEPHATKVQESADALTAAVAKSYASVFAPSGDLYEEAGAADADTQGGGRADRYAKRAAFYEALGRLFHFAVPTVNVIVDEAKAKPCMQPVKDLKGWASWLYILAVKVPRGKALKVSLVNSLAMIVCSALLFVIDLRYRTVGEGETLSTITIHWGPHWALVTAALVMSDGAANIMTGCQRMRGTLVGAVYAACVGTYVLVAFEDGESSYIGNTSHRIAISLAAIPFQMLVSFFSGFEFTSMALTSPLVLCLCVNQPYESANKFAFYRIKETTIGVVVAMLIQIPLSESAHTVMRTRLGSIISALADDIDSAFAPWTSEKDAKAAEPMKPKAGALVGASLMALPSAAFEPALWRQPFSKPHHEKVLRTTANAAKLAAKIGGASHRGGSESFPAGAAEALAKVGKELHSALFSATSSTWQADGGAAALASLGCVRLSAEEALADCRTAIIRAADAGEKVPQVCCFAYICIQSLVVTVDEMGPALRSLAAVEKERGTSLAKHISQACLGEKKIHDHESS